MIIFGFLIRQVGYSIDFRIIDISETHFRCFRHLLSSAFSREVRNLNFNKKKRAFCSSLKCSACSSVAPCRQKENNEKQ